MMLGAVAQLQAGGFFVNADVGRQGNATAEIVGQHAAAGVRSGKILRVAGGHQQAGVTRRPTTGSVVPPGRVVGR
ncbi:MAG: hypothetical protein R2713_20540 [Ilumatobacteraceae bacterium]